MNKYFRKLPAEFQKILGLAKRVSGRTLMPAYLVGGCLRDLILGVKNFDLDITVVGDGILFAKCLAAELKSQLLIHERFRTATLILCNGLKVDIATARKEKYPSPAALPVVSPGSLEQDLKRRDFTINAMALAILGTKEPEIIDPFGGQADLALGRIRILHDLSFKDDPTRIFRAIRFSQRFNFKIEAGTLRLLKMAITEGLLDQVNPHRMRDELILILQEPDPGKPIRALGDLGGLSFISTKLKVKKYTLDHFKRISQEVTRFVKEFPARRKLDTWLIYLAALLEPLTLAQIKNAICKLGLCKGQVKRLNSYFLGRKKLVRALSKKQVLPQQIFSLLEPLSYETIILLGLSSQNINFKRYLADYFKFYHGMRLCVSGQDLGGLGVLPGPEYQKIFDQVLAAKLSGKVSNRQTELDLIKKLVQD